MNTPKLDKIKNVDLANEVRITQNNGIATNKLRSMVDSITSKLIQFYVKRHSEYTLPSNLQMGVIVDTIIQRIECGSDLTPSNNIFKYIATFVLMEYFKIAVPNQEIAQ